MSISRQDNRKPLTYRVAEEVRALMGRRQVTQTHLAAVLHLPQASISNRLHGRTPFDANEIGVLAAFFRVAPAVLVGGASSPRPNEWAVGDSNPEPTGYGHTGLRLARPRSDSFSQRQAA